MSDTKAHDMRDRATISPDGLFLKRATTMGTQIRSLDTLRPLVRIHEGLDARARQGKDARSLLLYVPTSSVRILQHLPRRCVAFVAADRPLHCVLVAGRFLGNRPHGLLGHPVNLP